MIKSLILYNSVNVHVHVHGLALTKWDAAYDTLQCLMVLVRYLRAEYLRQLESPDPVRYVLQVQITPDEEPEMWNPQMVSPLTVLTPSLCTLYSADTHPFSVYTVQC